MQTRDFVSGLHNCREFSQSLECLYQEMQTQEKVFYCFYKITSFKNYNAGKVKKINFTDQNASSYNINLTMTFLNWPIKTYFFENLVIGGVACTTLRHTTVFIYFHANTPLGQSERAYYLSYFINKYIIWILIYKTRLEIKTTIRSHQWLEAKL